MGYKSRQEMSMGARFKGQGKGEVKKIKVEGDRGQEVTVCCKTVLQRKEKSTFGWFEEFTIGWSETLISRDQRKTHRKGE